MTRLVLAVALGCATFVACDSTDETELLRLHNLGKAHFENGETEEAITLFERCVAGAPESWTYRVSLAKANFLAEHHDLAIQQFTALLEERFVLVARFASLVGDGDVVVWRPGGR